MPGYEHRPQQIEAALAVEQALALKDHCIVEAGTGVGKSLAYLIPAIEHARAGKKVVVSTFTLYLQSQLMSKDIPFLETILPGRKIKAAVMKGRGNYLCLRNFDQEFAQMLLVQDPNLFKIQKWLKDTETGDIAELGFSFPGWSDICSEVDSCHNRRCSFNSKCFYYKARKAAEDADIIVTNHSLFCSDLGIRSVDPNMAILPLYDAVIFDEAHHLEDVATKAFGVEVGSFRIPSLLNRIRRLRGAGVESRKLDVLDDLNAQLFGPFQSFPKTEFFFRDIYGHSGQEQLEETATMLCSTLQGLYHEIGDIDTTGQPELKDRIDVIRRMCAHLQEDIETLFFGPTDGWFKWGDRRQDGKSPTCFLRHSPLSVAEAMGDLLWKNVDSAILTSATLANSGTFKFVKERLGMPECIEKIEDSPFDFSRQCMLYIPRHLPFPSEQAAYTEMVAKEIEGLVKASGGRAFLLFTSHRMLNAVYDRLWGRLPFPMMRQGDMSNESLVQEFLKGKNGVLFGTHSFWEGVDVRGEALSCVVIDKLPFASPENPVNKARTDAITEEGGDWFNGYSVPQAQIKLKQGFGRLIRTKTDRGVVAILDSRLVKKAYGREFLRFLPQCPVTNRIEDVERFFHIILATE
jgi:ATP-dependent DNA helicase DinG